jgi:FAD:protein FMN transferase
MPVRSIHFDGIGTHWWIEMVGDSADIDPQFEQQLRAIVGEFSADFSRFDDYSFVGRLNRLKELEEPPQEMLDILAMAREMYELSDGVFNISVGGALHKMGYGTRALAGTIDRDMWQHIQVTPQKITLPRDMTIDFGGLGKGWLVDKIARFIEASGREEYVVNGGGDIMVASNTPLYLGFEHPHDSSRSIGRMQLTRGALAVSSTEKRVWKDGDVTRHHIIDPTTGAPSETTVINTFVRADSALIADITATILTIRPELLDRFVEKFDVKTILLTADDVASLEIKSLAIY